MVPRGGSYGEALDQQSLCDIPPAAGLFGRKATIVIVGLHDHVHGAGDVAGAACCGAAKRALRISMMT
jgi:hypothetical protein